jgi:hypothetical protein
MERRRRYIPKPCREYFLKNIRRNRATKNPEIAEEKKPVRRRRGERKNTLSWDEIWKREKRNAPNIIGIPKRKEKYVAFSLLIPENIPATVTIPDREIPGRREKI